MMMEWYDQIQRDVRLAGRRARRHATFTVAVIVCVALGIGAVTSVLSVLYPVLMSPVPFRDSDRLVQIGAYDMNRSDEEARYFISWYVADVLEREREVLSGVAAFYQRDFDVTDGAEPERIPGAETVPGSFDVVGLRPLLGRTLRAEDAARGRRVALISESLWDRRYGRDPLVIGRTITLGDRSHEIVGVVPGPVRLTARAEIFPVHQPDDYTYEEQLGLGVFLTIGRIPEGAGLESVQSDLDATLRASLEAEPIFFRDLGLDAMDLRDFLVGDFRSGLYALLASAAFVLVLATANVVNLLMARSQSETWERGLRTALGARRSGLARQGLVENLAIAGLGGLVGLGVGALGTSALLGGTRLGPAFDEAGISPPIVLAGIGLSAALAVIMSLLPASTCYRDLELVQRGAVSPSSAGQRRARGGFVVTQVALSFVLLVGAALMGRTVGNLAALDLGFEPDALAVARVSAPPSQASTAEGRSQFTAQILDALRALPGARAVGAVAWVPFDDPDVGFNYSVEDFPPEVSGERALAPGRIITPGYFAAMGIPLLSGRDFDDRDAAGAPQTAIVSRAFEGRYWPDGSALGKRIKRGAYTLDRPWIEIVGVVGDIRSGVLSDPIKPAVFYAHAQSSGSYLAQMAYILRSPTRPEALLPAVRSTVREIAPQATVYGTSTGPAIREIALGRARFNRTAIGVFAVIGLLLALAGVFGVAAYGVARRTRELGVRVALGARPTQVRGLVLGGSLRVVATGLAIGTLGAAALTAGLSDLLFEIEPGDIPTYVLAALVLVSSTLVASYIPARRATRVDPTVALKSD